MLGKNFALLFYLKKRGNYAGGKLPVYIRITVDGFRSEISARMECEPEKWNSVSGRKVGTKEEAKSFNALLDTIRAKVYEAYRQAVEKGIPISAESIKEILKGTRQSPRKILEIFKDHNNKMAVLVGNGFAKGTLTKYKTCYAHVNEFLRYRYKKEDLEIEKLDHEFISEFEFWLKSVKSCEHNTAMKYLTNFKKVVMICVKNDWLPKDPFINFKMSKKVVNRQALTESELNRIIVKDFQNTRLNQVKDIFVFCCFTGLSYVDVNRLSRNDLMDGPDGNQWLAITRQKTGSQSRLPLLSPALSILKRYEDHPVCVSEGRLLPVLSNQKMNSYLKEIGDLCRIDKPITFHLARHTFATTVTLTNGVPMETVSRMLGHANIRTTQIYAKIVDSKISEDMGLLKTKF